MVRFDTPKQAMDWLIESHGNKEERAKIDGNQKFAFHQVHWSEVQITGLCENNESDNGIPMPKHDKLVQLIYDDLQSVTYGRDNSIIMCHPSKEIGYATKNFVLGAIEYFLTKEGY